MIRFPNCKINLGLYILEKLPDGYHRIETVFYPTGLSDILEIIPSNTGETRLDVSGINVEGKSSDNLCFKAWKLLYHLYGIPAVSIHLHKIIPTGAGLGGGSSDAAFTLSMLNELFELRLSDAELSSLALKLGMDCPYFLMNTPALGSGKGEILEPIDLSLKGWNLVIVKPPVHVSTAAAYAGVTPRSGRRPLTDIVSRSVEEWKELLVNDFETSIFSCFPEIRRIKDELCENGALYASMSGSGSAVYGLFREKPDLGGKFKDCFSVNLAC